MMSPERRSRGEKTALASLSPPPSYRLYSANLFAASVGGESSVYMDGVNQQQLLPTETVENNCVE